MPTENGFRLQLIAHFPSSCSNVLYFPLYQQPRFSETPLKTDEDVNNWLRFYEMSAPLVCVGVLESHDPVSEVKSFQFGYFPGDCIHTNHPFSTHASYIFLGTA